MTDGFARLLVLAGPSGVGKGSVLSALRGLRPDLWVSVSVTTRLPRPGEVDGEHYHFATRERFDRLVADGELLEHAEYAGSSYGTPREPVLRRLGVGAPSALEIELLGARQIRQALGDQAWLVLLQPPSMAELADRLRRRGTEDPAALERRLRRAEVELAAAAEFDAALVNGDVEETAAQLLESWSGAPAPTR